MGENLTWKIVLILVLVALASAIVVVDFKDVKLGFDLKGGVELRYKVEGVITKAEEDAAKTAEDQEKLRQRKQELETNVTKTAEVIRRRLDPDGTLQPDIRPEVGGELVIRLQGLTRKEVNRIRQLAEAMGVLEFRMVVPKNEYNRMSAETRKTRDVQEMTLDEKTTRGEISEKLFIQRQDEYNITGAHLRGVRKTLGEQGVVVAFDLDAVGAEQFSRMTKYLADRGTADNPRRLAILLNGKLQCAPTVRHQIMGGGAVIENMEASEVDDTITVLQAGSLPTRLIYESEMFIGPELGADSLARGKTAIVVSVVLVLLFMVVYYLVSGLIADFAVMMNLLFLFAVMLVSGSVFTLPGIAGMALTVGMLVDANILINERIREELAAGKVLRFAIKTGYERAFWVIFDTHLTTIITGIVLWIFLTGPVRWFAVTLVIGLVASMFTSLFVTRVILDLLVGAGWMKKMHMVKLLTKPNIRFVRWAPMWMSISAVLIVAGMTAFIIRGRENLGIDFTPGNAAQLSLNKVMNIEEVRKIVYDLGYDNAQIVTAYLGANEVNKTESSQFIIRIPQRSANETQAERQEVLQRIAQAFAPWVDTNPVVVQYNGATPITDKNDPYAGGQQVTVSFYTEEKPKTSPSELTAPKGTPAEMPKAPEIPTAPEAGKANDNKSATTTENTPGVLEPAKLTQPRIAEALERAGLGKVEVLKQENRYLDKVTFKTHESSAEKIRQAVTAKGLIVIPYAFTYELSVEPAQAQKMIWYAIEAVLVSMFFIVVYVGIRFGSVRYGVAAIVALGHDVLFMLGAIAGATYLAGTAVGRWLQLSQVDLDLNVVAAVLTVVGYSINDTIVVFDRIRENLGRRKAVTAELIDRSVNQTLSRTLLTSFTVLLVCLTLYITGGRQLHALAFCLTIGVVVGTYSSIFIANPLLIMTTRGLPSAEPVAVNGTSKVD